MNAPKVILINRMLGYGGLNTLLKGQSGKSYGQPSRYSTEYKCHIVELSFAEYEAGREDIFRKMRGALSGFVLWEPKFIMPEGEWKSYPFPDYLTTVASSSPSTKTDKPKWNDLVKTAKAAGVKIKKGGSREDLLKAIQEHEAAKAAHHTAE